MIALAVAETASWGTLHYSFGILLRPMANDLGLSEVVVSGAYSVALLAGGLAAAPVGRALDRRGARAIMSIGALVATFALLALSGARGIATLYIAWAVIGLSQAAVLYEPAFAAITSWFEHERDRVRALMTVTIVGGLASTIFGPLIAHATSTIGWRATVLALACVLLLFVTPIHASLPTARPIAKTKRTSHDDVRVLSMVFAVHAFVSAGIAVHLVAHLVEKGASMTEAATMAGLLGVAQVAGRLVSGSFRALHGSTRGALLFGAQSVALLAIGSGPVVIGIVLYGLANGLVTIERATVVAERFGRERYGENSGRIARVGLVARAFAPFAVGWARSRGLAFPTLAALLALAAVALTVELAPRQTVR